MNPEGRPTVFTEEALQLLEGAFADGASDKLACFLARISEASLYNYQKEHPEFIERKYYLKDQVKFQARKNIREKIKVADIDTSKWYLERRDKAFKPKSDLTTDDKPFPIYAGQSKMSVSGYDGYEEDIPIEETD